jgi:rhodanese-related sulfurtransferase
MRKIINILLIVSICVLGCQEKKAQNDSDLSVIEFESQMLRENSFLLDVRTPDEVAAGKIKGASVLNIMGPEFEKEYMYLPKNKILYVYCRSGNRSRKALQFLKEHGFDSVYHLDGGITAWLKEGKLLEK